MTRGVFLVLTGIALVAGLALRLPGLGDRPMHHDEANQAVKFGLLLEHAEYQYDPTDHHGPTLYYLTLPSAWLRGQTTLASLDETTVRLVPVAFGAGLILLCALLAPAVGRTAAASSAILMAVSPAFTYYSRFYIQETLFVFFTMAFVLALGRAVQRPQTPSLLLTGVAAGLAFSTKETAAVTLVAAVLAAGLAYLITPREAPPGHYRSTLAVFAIRLALTLGSAVAVAFLFFSSWFSHPERFVDAILAFGTYVDRGLGATAHVQPWNDYLGRLAWFQNGGLVWSESLILGLALVGAAAAFRRGAGFWPRYLVIYAVVATAVFSAMPYKTPWNLLAFHAGLVVAAGVGVDLLARFVNGRVARAFVIALLTIGVAHLALQGWRASTRYGADPRNPYVYAHTSPDFLRLVHRIEGLAAVHPDAARMLVKVIAGPYEQWPLPWYLRRFERVGYWPQAADAARLDGSPVVVASQDQVPAVDAALGDRYVSEFYGLRPEVMLTLYVERGLWDRFLAAREAAPSVQR